MAVPKKDFFISYNQADRQWAEWIAWQLEQQRYSTSIQAWDFRPGSNFVLEMQRAAAEASRTIAVLSPDYLAAEFTQPEWAAAFAQDPTGADRTLVPVRVRECTLEGLLAQIVYINLAGANDEARARQVLLDGVRPGRAAPAAPPAFPGRPTRTVAGKPGFPGALPAIWNVPHARNPNFTGRDGLLTVLRAALTSGQAAAVTQAISGLGGVGKTQLATEYVYRYGSAYDLVWWVPAEEPAALAATYAALAAELDLPDQDATEQSAMVEGVRRELAQRGGWLLVLDNAPGPLEVRGYLPNGASGHVLITSRNPVWGGLARPLPVDSFQRAESVEFLRRRTEQTDQESADQLAEALGDLPLALEQAGAYIEETGTTLAAYLDLFRDRRSELWGEEHPPLDYQETIATTWEISLRQLPPEAAELMNLCAFLAPDAIPRDLLEVGEEKLSSSLASTLADSLVLNRAVGALRRFSLIEVSGSTWSVHRLVQAVVRDRLPAAEGKTWAEAAVELLNTRFPSGIATNPATWPACARLLPHALVAAGHAEALATADETTGRLLNQVGGYLRSRAEFSQAREIHQRALAIDERAYGPDHPEVATDVNNLGLVLQDLGDLAGAREYLQRALAIDEQVYGPDHPEVATDVNNLGRVLHDLGDLAGAQDHLQRALAIAERAYGPDHPAVATDLNNLGRVLHDLGDLAGAREHLQRALAIAERVYSPDHPAVAIDLNNLGLVLRDLGDLPGAREHYQRALAIAERAYGPDYPAVATYLNNLGSVLRDLGDLAGAREHLQRVLAIDERVYGPDHPTVAIDLNNLGSILLDLGDLAGAREHLQRALAILTDRLGPDHPNTVLVRKNLESLGPP